MNGKDSLVTEHKIRRSSWRKKTGIATNVVSIKRVRLTNAERRYTIFPSITVEKGRKGGKFDVKPRIRRNQELIKYFPFIPKLIKSLRKKTYKLMEKTHCYRLLCVNKKTLHIEEIQIANTVVLKQGFKKLPCFIVSGSTKLLRFILGKSDSYLFVTKDFSSELIEKISSCKSVNCRPIAEHCFFTLLKKHNISQIKVNTSFLQQTKELYSNNKFQLPLLLEIPLNILKHQSYFNCPVIDIEELQAPLPVQKENIFFSPTYNILPSIDLSDSILPNLVHLDTHSISIGTYNIENHSILAVNGSFLSGTAGSLLLNEKGRPIGLLGNLNRKLTELKHEHTLELPLVHQSTLQNKALSFYSSKFLKLSEAFINFMYTHNLVPN